jgi:hypothetical protein
MERVGKKWTFCTEVWRDHAASEENYKLISEKQHMKI